MNYEKAYKELLSGKKIRRKGWEELRYLQIKDNEVIAYQGEYTHCYEGSNLLISDGWKLVDGDGTTMTFMEAIEHLKNKKCITKDNMGEAFLFIDSDQLTLCKPVEFVFMPTWSCLNQNDWEIIK